ncbi:hypothetical protein BKA67DRAFT_551471 [Truncatella angustata]|uniref:Uncharacterized protein n=1 Tax=Truncatella angustata TaxID=152316 RepID=A0A9P9A0S6_9PEZI|nr:uncharacterized protein BKA67DRAFT_551471 [Truncatella angustata]KAH6656285.1 hypothetical protein BKA67DRAFT_551471 [Truncatella angustata]KAH8202149.1 hypothetical protein TruAng_003727 [Truncatella angustata]
MSYSIHEQASPATSNATNRTNRGGRPKDWTEPRTRRLSRLYVYTSLKVDDILKILEDDVWCPGKEAANKHLHKLLGKDPRWMRPKDVTEQRQRMAGLKTSDRGRSSSQSSSISQNMQSPMSAVHDPFTQTYQRTGTMDSSSFGRSSASSLEKNDTFMFNSPMPPRTNTRTFNIPTAANHNTGLRNLNNSSTTSFARYIPGVGRQGTSMTTSTNFSVASDKTREAYYSIKEKLHGHEVSDLKDIFRLLKRFTISNEADSERSSSSPSSATGIFQPPSFARFHGQTEGVTVPGLPRYTLPGEFIQTEHSSYDSMSGKDQFGNTMYHFLAASEEDMDNLIGLISQESQAYNPLLNVTNTGGQTFLHVLHKGWFREDSRLIELANELLRKQFNFHATDNYGRTFFHVLRQNMNADSVLIRKVTGLFGNNMSLLNRRDAFGAKPMQLRAATFPTNREEARPTLLTIPSAAGRSQQKITDHAQLLRIINGANTSPNGPSQEDAQGRNALHCLSEVILGVESIEAHANGTKLGKRKRNAQDETVPQNCPLSQRLQYLETVLQANVDVNHYNASGNTVLMSFVSHIIDGEDDKDFEQLIKRLLKAGANLESRNRNGETVLQVAAKLGQKFAVKVLLEQGANFHVHNSDGRSVLQTIDDQTRLSGDNAEDLARLEATRGVLTGRFSKFQVIQQPTLLQEWQVRSAISPKLV